MTLSLERRADLWGDRTAVVDPYADRRVSYAELESEADATARKLTALGVGPNDAVAVLSRNRVETLALLFAVRRLGAVLAPISHRLTPATVEGPLETVDPAVVVHEAAQRDLVREVPDDRGYSFEELGREDGQEYERADRDLEDSLLYLHDTVRADRPAVGEDGQGANRPGRDEHGSRSGRDEDRRRGESLNEDPQTASPVVTVPERAVEWNCITAVAAWGLGRDDCAPALVPFSDTDGLHRLTLPLLYVGGRVVVLRAFDPEDALAAVAEEGATALFAGATEYRELVESEAFEATDFESVEWVGTRSALPADAREALAREAPIVRTHGRVETGPNNLYRPAEGRREGGRGDGDGGGDGNEGGNESEESGSADPDCVGRPFLDCEARIVDERGNPVPEGANGSGEGGEASEGDPEGTVGELEFRGPVTATGYLSGDGATDEFPEWVPTGDLAYHENGDYYLLGPADQALGSASARVHPREIERALEAREGVTAAGVVPDDEGVLAAFVGEAEPGELRAVLEDALPEGATVRELDRVESLPRRATGEVDRAALRRQLGGEERIGESEE